jgi:ubiquinone/menaquinone biosynthesis C-methylase UbiE
MKEYYDRRAPEYDDWYLGRGRYATRDADAWQQDLDGLVAAIDALPAARTLDVACGTGFLTRHLHGDVVGLDQSAGMLEEARRQAPRATFVRGDGLALPFPNSMFSRVFTSHFYGHLHPDERQQFLREARRVAGELVVVDAAVRPDHAAEEVQERVLRDGSVWPVLKRYFTAAGLAAELSGGETLYDGAWFVAVRSFAPRVQLQA